MSAPRLRDVIPRNSVFASWERQRNKKEVHWIMECFAEMVRPELVVLLVASYNLQLTARGFPIYLPW